MTAEVVSIVILSSSVAEKGAEGCKDLMEAFAACVKSAAEGTSWGVSPTLKCKDFI